MPWRDYGGHPNALGPRQYRHEQLTSACEFFSSGDRIDVLREYARDKNVLDLGCVSHSFKFRSGGRGKWLHQHLVDVAAECVGADYDAVGIEQMQEAGYDAVHVDIMGDLTPVLERGPFDVVIAGELIEHLPAPQQLLVSARRVLRPGGQLVITTPNPYSPRRVRAGQRGITWENVDHVVYIFPSGMAEMADRTGFALTRFGTVGWPVPKPLHRQIAQSAHQLGVAFRKRVRGQRDPLSATRLALPLPQAWQSPLDITIAAARGDKMTRETCIYVLSVPQIG